MSAVVKPETKILNEAYARIRMPNTLYVGDPMYFEEYEDNASELERLTYAKRFRRPNWVGSVQVVEAEEFFEFNGGWESYGDYFMKIALAPDETLLRIYEKDQHLKRQRSIVKRIGVDTAEYIFGFNNQELTIHTGADGFIGAVVEYWSGSKLEGLYIELGFGDLYSFEEMKQKVSYLLEATFK